MQSLFVANFAKQVAVAPGNAVIQKPLGPAIPTVPTQRLQSAMINQRSVVMNGASMGLQMDPYD